MYWNCKHCETTNESESLDCVVCGARRPYLKNYECIMSEIYGLFILKWETENATELSLHRNGIETSLELTGSHQLYDCKNKEKIELVLKNNVADYRYEIIILFDKPIIELLEVDSYRKLANDKISVKWKTRNSKKVRLVGIGDVESVGSKLIDVECNEIRLIAESEVGSVEAVKKIEIIPIPIINFSTDRMPSYYEVGETITFTWQIDNATNVRLETPLGNVDVTTLDKYKVNATENFIFKIIATALDKHTTFEKEIAVKVCPKPEVCYFKIEPEVVVDAMPVKLSWKVNNSHYVDIDKVGVVEEEGSCEVFCEKWTEFTLTAKGEFSEVSLKATAKVLPTPIIESLKVPIPNFESHFHINIDIQTPTIDVSIKNPIKADLPFIELSKPVMPKKEIVLKKCLLKLPSIYNKLSYKIQRCYNHVNRKIRITK